MLKVLESRGRESYTYFTQNLSINRELAQLVERHPYKVDVAGSNPVLPTI